MLTLLQNSRLFAPERVGTRDLLIAAGRILAVAERIEPPTTPFPIERIDLGGARTLPGLIDPHLHATGGGGESGPASRVPPLALSALVQGGITTCIGLLGTDGTTRTIEDLVARTLGLRAEGISAYCYTGSYQLPPPTLTGSVRGDIVFVDPILGVGEVAISDHRSSQPTFDEIVKLAADCHVAGLMSGKAGVLHLHLGDGERRLALVNEALDKTELPARTFYPTHVNRNRPLFEESKALAVRGCTVDVTAAPADGDGLSAEDAIESWLQADLPARRLTCSSDGAGCLPVFDETGRMVKMDIGRPVTVLATLQALLQRGVALERALPIFTSNPADLLRLHDKGRLREGADADLLVLDDDGKPLHLMARGRWLLRDGEVRVHGMFEQGVSS